MINFVLKCCSIAAEFWLFEMDLLHKTIPIVTKKNDILDPAQHKNKSCYRGKLLLIRISCNTTENGKADITVAQPSMTDILLAFCSRYLSWLVIYSGFSTMLALRADLADFKKPELIKFIHSVKVECVNDALSMYDNWTMALNSCCRLRFYEMKEWSSWCWHFHFRWYCICNDYILHLDVMEDRHVILFGKVNWVNKWARTPTPPTPHPLRLPFSAKDDFDVSILCLYVNDERSSVVRIRCAEREIWSFLCNLSKWLSCQVSFKRFLYL